MDSQEYAGEYVPSQPISKTITVVWDVEGDCWRDRETGVAVKGIMSPRSPMGVPADYHGSESVRIVEAGHHPFDKSFHITYEQAQKMINDTIDQRSIPKQLMYFVEGDWLITFAHHHETVQAFSHMVNQLERRIERLERPWWKVW